MKQINKNNSALSNIVILIPSLDPDHMLGKYVSGLIKAGFGKIVVVNDGSNKEYDHYFEDLKDKGVTTLKHAVNQGKGRALKTGFHYILNTYSPEEVVGVVTADADGQHCVEDTVIVALQLAKDNSFVLGSRDFN